MACWSCFTDIIFSNSFLLVAILLVLGYYVTTLNHDFFAKRSIPYMKPMPLFGCMFKNLCKQQNFADLMMDCYNAFPNSRVSGAFEFQTPLFVVRDPELIKKITVKDWDHFINHRFQMDEEVEPLFGRSLFMMRDQKWKNMRSTLSPAFTGSKMRIMFSLVAECSKNTVEVLTKDIKNGTLDIELKTLFTRFSNDVIASTAFGVQVNSINDDQNEFYQMGKKVSKFDGVQAFKFFGFNNFPRFMKFFKISLFDDATLKFFRKLVFETMDYREKHNLFRPDMINLLMQAKKNGFIDQKNFGGDKEAKEDKFEESAGFATVEESEALNTEETVQRWEDDDLTAQCLIFFLAGFETTAIFMAFTCHELAVNPDIQDKLLREIDDVKEELGDSALSYEVMQKMKYLDMVVSETLRKWPPSVASDRLCTKPYVLEDSDGVKIQLNVNDCISLPTYPIQMDPQYYPNPEKFDPERFSEANKDKIKPFTYFPFGSGPRNCIGSRFALMECKAIIFSILSNFYLEMGEKTQNPMKLKKDSFNLMPENGFWVRMRVRDNKN